MSAVYSAVNVRIDNGSYIFDVKNTRWNFKRFSLWITWKHNLMNALMAIAMAVNFGTPTDAIAKP
jgi:UDP-N-acetylmuramate--alanine ligase